VGGQEYSRTSSLTYSQAWFDPLTKKMEGPLTPLTPWNRSHCTDANGCIRRFNEARVTTLNVIGIQLNFQCSEFSRAYSHLSVSEYSIVLQNTANVMGVSGFY
jgi:hypothetical protein